MDPEKVEAIVRLDPPNIVTEVLSFLGMCGYYRNCIEGFTKVAEPLVRLTQKNIPFKWEAEQQEAFQALKDMLVSARVMAYPRTDQPYKLYTDACEYAIGAILVHDDENGVRVSSTERRTIIVGNNGERSLCSGICYHEVKTISIWIRIHRLY